MPVGKKLAVVLSVVVIGTVTAIFFRKDASQFKFWQTGPEDPFGKPVERRVVSEGAPLQQALRVPPSATAAIAEPRGAAPEGQPAFQRNLTPVGALLPPIESVVDGDDEGDAADAASSDRSSFAQARDVSRHVVADGDTLSQLAARYLGRAEAYLEIYDINRDVLSSPDLLPIGAVLRIPPRGGTGAGAFDDGSPSNLVPVTSNTERGRP